MDGGVPSVYLLLNLLMLLSGAGVLGTLAMMFHPAHDETYRVAKVALGLTLVTSLIYLLFHNTAIGSGNTGYILFVLFSVALIQTVYLGRKSGSTFWNRP